jgi:uncharacterized protein YhaN
LSIHKAEIYKLETFRDALTLAKDKIEESANEIHHNFAPRLAIAVGRKLTVVTGGRYDMVNLDPASLHVTVKEPSINQMINVEQLSFGTKELMYLLLRVELARLMSNLHESIPLFMDDAFVNIDSSRLLKILDYMADLAKENQILFFTKDAQIVDWFHSSLSGNSLNCLFSISADGSIKEERR